MKKLIYALYGFFVVLMGVTFYVAHVTDDGLVEENYYEKAADFFGPQQAGGFGRVPDCEIDRGACRKRIGGHEVAIDVTPKPVRAMEELIFELRVRRDPSSAARMAKGPGMEGLPSQITLYLSMPGMYMGTNRVFLKRTSAGEYSGRGVIPRCPGGGKLWMASIRIPQSEEVGFTFNVSY